MKQDNSGQAFPCPGLSGLPNGNFIHPEGGMTMRQYYAGEAMKGLLAAGALTQPAMGCVRPYNEREVAEQAFAMADNMTREGDR